MSCLKKQKAQNSPFFYSSLTMHSINKLDDAKRRVNSKPKLDKLKKELIVFVEFNKVSFLQSEKTSSTNAAFKTLKNVSRRSSFPKVII